MIVHLSLILTYVWVKIWGNTNIRVFENQIANVYHFNRAFILHFDRIYETLLRYHKLCITQKCNKLWSKRVICIFFFFFYDIYKDSLYRAMRDMLYIYSWIYTLNMFIFFTTKQIDVFRKQAHSSSSSTYSCYSTASEIIISVWLCWIKSICMRFKEIEFCIVFLTQQISLFLRACVFSRNSTRILHALLFYYSISNVKYEINENLISLTISVI